MRDSATLPFQPGWFLVWPAKAREMTQPGPHSRATETLGHSFTPKPGCKPVRLHKHLLYVNSVPGLQFHILAFLLGLGGPLVGPRGETGLSLGTLLNSPKLGVFLSLQALATLESSPLNLHQSD